MALLTAHIGSVFLPSVLGAEGPGADNIQAESVNRTQPSSGSHRGTKV